MNAFTFATESAYLTSKAGGDIYSALQSSSEVSRSAVSYCKDTGKTYIDSVNVIVDRDKGGDIGDCLLLKGGVYYWLKSFKAYNASEKGGCYGHETSLSSAGYTRIGFVINRVGRRCLLCSMSDTTYAQWSDNTTVSIPEVTTYSAIRRGKNYDTWICGGSLERAEELFGTGVYTYTWPLPRASWDACIANVNSNESASGTFENGSWTTTASSTGMATASITYTCTEGGVTINPKDYGYSFEKWYNAKVLLKYPTDAYCMKDWDGRKNTRAMVAYSSATEGVSCPAAVACDSYAVSGASDFGAHSWWMPSVGEMWCILRYYHRLVKKGCPIANSWYWTSTQYSSANAWYVTFNPSFVTFKSRSYSSYVRAVSAFDI